MTAPTWTEITDTEIQPGKAARAITGRALRDNVKSVAGRGTGAPWLNGVGAIQQLTGSGNFTVPAGVYRIKVRGCAGGGGGGDDNLTGGTGGTTTFGAISANGGAGGARGDGVGSSYFGGDGGTASGGDLNIAGGDGFNAIPTVWSGAGGCSAFGGGAKGSGEDGVAFGSGGAGRIDTGAGYYGGGGGAGGYFEAVITVTPGALIAYAVGAGGAGADVNSGNGAPGTIIVEY